MKKVILQAVLAFSCTILLAVGVAAHCEIPCGIYDDGARIDLLLEHVATIEKSMKQISAIQNEKNHNANQLVRWITNKENHANELQEIVTQYFMTQRIKFDAKAYDKKLALLHKMLVSAMKCKQTTDLEHTESLTKAIQEFKKLYFEK